MKQINCIKNRTLSLSLSLSLSYSLCFSYSKINKLLCQDLIFHVSAFFIGSTHKNSSFVLSFILHLIVVLLLLFLLLCLPQKTQLNQSTTFCFLKFNELNNILALLARVQTSTIFYVLSYRKCQTAKIIFQSFIHLFGKS